MGRAFVLQAELGLKEGLAQYYTDRVLHRLDHRAGAALRVFQALLPRQPPVYRAHEPWLEASSEAVRRAMLEIRHWKENSLSKFNDRLQIANSQLKPENHAAPF